MIFIKDKFISLWLITRNLFITPHPKQPHCFGLSSLALLKLREGDEGEAEWYPRGYASRIFIFKTLHFSGCEEKELRP